MQPKTIIILSVTSDIGKYLAQQYVLRGWKVIGTYRNKDHIEGLQDLNNCHLFCCDVTNNLHVNRLIAKLKSKGIYWNRFISCVGHLLPAQPFFKSDFNHWHQSIEVNAIAQLQVLHQLHALHAKNAQVVFFAGGGVNNSITDITAYTVSKILLTKMVEYLDAENKDMSFLSVGPGWTKTKIHHDLLKSKEVSKLKSTQVRYDLKKRKGTSYQDIDQCIDWLCGLPKEKVSGRNFSVAHDSWQRHKCSKLEDALKQDHNMYKLRRYKNDF